MFKVALLVFVISFQSVVAKADTLTFLAGDFCPYNCDPLKEEGRLGFTHDILNKIFPEHEIIVERVAWERAFKEFNSEKESITGIIGITKELPINKEISYWPEHEIGQYTHAFYALKNSSLATWKYDGLASLKGKYLGAARGFSYCSAEMTEYVKKAPPSSVSPLAGNRLIERNLHKLSKQRIDLWLANIPMADYFMFNNKEKAAGVIRVDKLPCTGVVDAYPVFYNDEKGKALATAFDKGIAALRTSGKLDEILSAYGVEDWVE